MIEGGREGASVDIVMHHVKIVGLGSLGSLLGKLIQVHNL